MDIRKKYLTQTEKADVKREILEQLRRLSKRYGVSEEDLNAARKRSNVVVDRMFFDEADGVFVPAEEAIRHEAMIYLNAESRSISRTVVIAHEMVRFLILDWVAQAVYGAETVICTDQDNDRIKQEIAEAVQSHY